MQTGLEQNFAALCTSTSSTAHYVSQRQLVTSSGLYILFVCCCYVYITLDTKKLQRGDTNIPTFKHLKYSEYLQPLSDRGCSLPFYFAIL